jgi:serine/threonine protein kinase
MDQIGRYQIVGELGRGAMGVVFRALDPSIGREVAIKTIRLSEFTNAEQRGKQRERLFREARSAGILSHPGIVTIYDIVEQDDTAYIAMEFVPGSTLEQLLSLKEPVAPEAIFSILRQTAAALDYAHYKGIVHRDIKPANIIVNEAGLAKITDFGIAKISAADQLTQTGLIVGTPNYMAPEQVQGKPVSGFADQYSLTVLAYEMLTGEKPFVAEHLTTLVYQIVCEPPPPARRLNPTLGAQIDGVLQKGLSKEPDQRYRNCAALVEALEAACAAIPGWKSLARGGSLNLPTMAESPPAPPPRVDPPVTPPVRDLPPPRVREEPEKTKSRAVPILVTLLVGCGAAAGIYFLQQPLVPEAPRPAPPIQETKKQEPPSKPVETVVERPPVASKAVEPDKPQPPVEEPEPPRRVTAPKTEPPRPPRPATSVEVPIRSQPSGATVTLDGLPGTACVTPCALKASGGNHTITLKLPGFKTLTRSVMVTDAAIELPVITMAQALGVLMLQSQPDGATIMIDEKKWPGITPTQISLPPGKYRFTLQKGDLKAVQNIEIHEEDFKHLSIALNQQ